MAICISVDVYLPSLLSALSVFRLNADIEVRNGGYIVIQNMDSPTVSNATYYYSGATKLVTAPFVFDRIAPFHCSADKTINCPTDITASNMLSVNGAQVRKQSQLTVSWDGWFDTAGGSGVSKYSLEMYQMEHVGHALSEKSVPFFRHSFSTSVNTHTIALNQLGLFSVVLYVHDVAGNYRIARRFVLYDNSSTVNVDLHHPLSFPKAVKFGNVLWKTVANGSVFAKWNGHFYNTLIKEDPLLQSISTFRQTIDSGYDEQPTGLLGLNGTVNYAGVVAYKYALSYGLYPQQPNDSVFQDVPKAATALWQHHNISTATSDGDHITVWVKAIDIWGNSATDRATVHVDFSGPDISNIGFTSGGETEMRLPFLNLQGLHTMQVTFDVDDPHSGVAMAFWKLGEIEGGSAIGKGRLLTRAKSQVSEYVCVRVCVCVHVCNNNTAYRLICVIV